MLIGIYSPAPQSGKSTVASHLLTKHHNFVSIPLAGTLKAMAAVLLDDLGIREDCLYAGDKTEIIYRDKTVRHVLQTLGTDWGRRMIGQDLWVDVWRGKVKRLMIDYHVVVDDVRFVNEADMVMEMGGLMLRVVRPGAVVTGTHPSEGALDNFPFTATIRNEGSVEDLCNKVDRLMENYK